MKERVDKVFYTLSTGFYGLLSVLFVFVLITSLGRNLIDMLVRIGWDWGHDGNYVGLVVGFGAYIVLAILLRLFRLGHNMKWFMKFTHELTHTLVALVFFAKIH